jgi:hypothetical protein
MVQISTRNFYANPLNDHLSRRQTRSVRWGIAFLFAPMVTQLFIMDACILTVNPLLMGRRKVIYPNPIEISSRKHPTKIYSRSHHYMQWSEIELDTLLRNNFRTTTIKLDWDSGLPLTVEEDLFDNSKLPSMEDGKATISVEHIFPQSENKIKRVGTTAKRKPTTKRFLLVAIDRQQCLG